MNQPMWWMSSACAARGTFIRLKLGGLLFAEASSSLSGAHPARTTIISRLCSTDSTGLIGSTLNVHEPYDDPGM